MLLLISSRSNRPVTASRMAQTNGFAPYNPDISSSALVTVQNITISILPCQLWSLYIVQRSFNKLQVRPSSILVNSGHCTNMLLTNYNHNISSILVNCCFEKNLQFCFCLNICLQYRHCSIKFLKITIPIFLLPAFLVNSGIHCTKNR